MNHAPLPQVAALTHELKRRGHTVTVDGRTLHITAGDGQHALSVTLHQGELSSWWHHTTTPGDPGGRICWAGVSMAAADRIEHILRGRS